MHAGRLRQQPFAYEPIQGAGGAVERAAVGAPVWVMPVAQISWTASLIFFSWDAVSSPLHSSCGSFAASPHFTASTDQPSATQRTAIAWPETVSAFEKIKQAAVAAGYRFDADNPAEGMRRAIAFLLGSSLRPES